MKAGAWCVVAGALAFAAGCGGGSGGGLPASGTGVSCNAGQYILDGGCVDLPPFSDATIAFDEDDAASSEDSPDDGGDASDGATDSRDASDASDAAPGSGGLDAAAIDASGDAPSGD